MALTNYVEDNISTWAASKYGTPATPTSTAAPAPAAAPAVSSPAAAASSASSTPNVSNWYTNVLGRTAAPAEVSYWQAAMNNGMSATDAYNTFLKSAQANHENTVNASTSLAAASAAPATAAVAKPVTTPTVTTPATAAKPAVTTTAPAATTTTTSTAAKPATTSTPAASIAAGTAAAAAAVAKPATTTAASSAPVATTSATPAAATSTPAATPAAAAPAAGVNVANWYRNELGREPSATEVAYWQNAINNGMDPQAAFTTFLQSAQANKETVTPTSWAQANATPAATTKTTTTSTPAAPPAVQPPASTPVTAKPAPTTSASTPSTSSPAVTTPVNTVPAANASTTTSTPAPEASNTSVNIANWYRNELGRDARPDEVAYWQNAINSGMDPQAVFAEFTKAAQANKESVTPTTWTQANAAATGTYKPAPAATTSAPATTPPSTSTTGGTSPATTGSTGSTGTTAATTPTTSATTPAANVSVLNWYRNELGRDARPDEVAYWQKLLDAGWNPQDLYAEFTKAAQANKEAITPTAWTQANNPATTYKPAPAATTTAPAAGATTGGTSGTGSQGSTGSTGATTPATGTTPDNSNINIAAWYLNELGRVPTSTELAYWQKALDGGADAQTLYSQFTQSALTNGEKVTPVSWATANSYTPGSASSTAVPGATAKPVTLDPSTLAVRTVDPATETVGGQINKLLAENSPVLQAAQASAMRAAADRGMLNSAMAASGGTNALIQQAEGIGTTDAAAYRSAADYNVAAKNQALMANNTNAQALQQLQLQLQDSAASRTNQLTLAQLQDATTRYTAQLSANTSKYNSDKSYQAQMDAQKNTLVNAIINNMDLSPDRKASMLQALGEGTMASAGNTGTGLAGAVYVIGSTSADLTGGTSAAAATQNAANQVLNSF